MLQSVGPCQPWSPIWCVTLPLSTAAVSGDALQTATEVLWAKSGRQFDECTVTLRPCRRDCWNETFSATWHEWSTGWPYPYLANGQWFNLGCGGCPGTCACTTLHTVELPMPVSSIVEVKVNGTPLVSGSYTLYDFHTLVRTDGQEWPLRNDLNLPDTAVGTWSITLTHGTAVPVAGRMAVAELTRELALACVGDGSCKLPQPVQQLVRQGVTMTFLDPNEVFADGKIGLYRSDLFISTFNPQGIAARAQVIDVDGPRHRRRTWPP